MTQWTAAHQASLSFTISQGLLIFMSTESVMLSNYLILCCPLLLLPSIFPSIRIFFNELIELFASDGQSTWSFSFSISPSNAYSGLISFRIYWFDLLEVQGALKSLLQHHSLKASILWGLGRLNIQKFIFWRLEVPDPGQRRTGFFWAGLVSAGFSPWPADGSLPPCPHMLFPLGLCPNFFL